jgi:hypothetical protein
LTHMFILKGLNHRAIRDDNGATALFRAHRHEGYHIFLLPDSSSGNKWDNNDTRQVVWEQKFDKNESSSAPISSWAKFSIDFLG